LTTLYSQRGEDIVFYDHSFELSRKQDFLTRSYLKIQAIIAYFGGFISFFKLLFEVLNKFLNQRDIIMLFEELIFRSL